jgi:HD-GYP domain-containing protein (c-di-GMP phosphodiesterase class II)/multisubunit Na+/H+ antiporter MnhG subunit
MGLAVVVAVLLSQGWPLAGMEGAYLAVGLAFLLGLSLALGWPGILLRERLVRVFLDCALVGVLIAYTGGAESPFFLLYFLAALGIAWTDTRQKVAAATSALVVGYPVAVLAAGGFGDLVSTPVALRTGFVALFCVVVTFLAAHVHGVKRLAVKLSSTLAREIDRVESDETLISEFSSVLKLLSLEGLLRWTVEAAHALSGGPYAHVASLTGNHHQTLMEADSDACPSWWHPAIQSLVLQSCRGGEVVRSEEKIHGINGFLAVPLGREEKWGAVIVGGGEFGVEEERALKLLAGEVAPALENAADAPGGLDQLTGLPNRTSLRRVLRRELSHGRPLTVLAMHPAGLRGRVDGTLLRKIGETLGNGRQRAFRYGDEEFFVLLGGSGEDRARRVARSLQQRLSEGIGATDGLPAVNVGWVIAETGDEYSAIGAAQRALQQADERPEGISGLPAGAQDPEEFGDERRVPGIARTLVEAMEAKDPSIKEHLRSVSSLSLRIGREMSLSGDQMEALANGALLHDVGKIGIPDSILQKTVRLTEEEYTVIKQHPALGVGILAPLEEMESALPVVKHHHERYDGRGYPDGLEGENIPLIARIVSVADAFDSMIRARPYGYGVPQEAALEEIRENSGTQFDPKIVSVLLEAVYAPDERRADSAG